MSETWSNFFDLLGAIFEVFGSLYLANKYLRRPTFWQIPLGLMSTLWKGERAEDIAFLSSVTEESERLSLKGILFLIIGFVVRSFPHIWYFIIYFHNRS